MENMTTEAINKAVASERKRVIQKMEELCMKWYDIHMFNSTGTFGDDERRAFVDYCKDHIDEFREFAKDTLEHPSEICVDIASLCNVLLRDELPTEEKTGWFEKLIEMSKRVEDIVNGTEWAMFMPCNMWLNHFKGTKDVDYYADYVDYKKYLNKHYIGWNPNKEKDPNPTYEEYVKEKNKRV